MTWRRDTITAGGEDRARTLSGERQNGVHGQHRCATRPVADILVPLPHLLADRRRHVLRRLRPLCRRLGAGRGGADQVRRAGTGAAVHLLDLRRHDHRLGARGLFGRQVRPALHLPVQPGGLRPGVVRRCRRTQHGLADRRPLRHGAGPRRRDRGWLLHHDRVRAARLARPLDGLHGLHRRGGLSGHLDHQHAGHPELRLAADVRDRGRRRPDRLVSAQEPAREPALARGQRQVRRGRSADAGDRARSLRRQTLASAGTDATGGTMEPGVALHAGPAAAPGRGLCGADHHQHADLRLRQLAADVLRPAGHLDHQVAGLHHGVGGRLADRLRHRRLVRGLFRPQEHHHRRVGAEHRGRRHLPLHGQSGAAAGRRLRPDRRHLHPDGAALRRLHLGTVSDRGAAQGQRPVQHAGPRRHHRLALHRAGLVQGLRRGRSAGA